ncbi:AfsR/SARP family transcriptional regulator [Gaiella sp.]|jgi:DNA-binding SARP family transcriptional activator|uniref:AfsR/SARP family transcriptional regulator n=1 Tax=Gaiella sp. TaxID=2663207 RepID=UPI002E3672EE|nr:AfsR/SARP family transcriptional regulator [Gaiella sp.]HEX5582740.1 AfsR/SARP family transcriptional regulator [Gaiella sp.]
MAAAGVEYRVLGPLEARIGDAVVPLGGRTQRALLAGLLLQANEAVSPARLVDLVWGQTPPATAEHAVSVYVSRLRKVLGADAIVRTPGGYLLPVAPGMLDLERFESLLAAAREHLAQEDPSLACELLDEALALWRGPALAGVELVDAALVIVERLGELRLTAVEARAEAKLALGRQREVIGELEALVPRHPHDERLCTLLMLALYRAGRQGEALTRYQEMRARLAEELGIEPSQTLRDLERKILAQELSLDLAPEAREIRSVVVVPRRLDQLEPLAALSEPFGLSKNPHEVILTWLEPPGPPTSVSAALREASTLLARLRESLVDRGARARVAAFTAADRVDDLLRVARRPEVDLLFLGLDLLESGSERLDDETAQILARAPCDVALWFARDGITGTSEEPIVVPFGALANDWAALELAAWIAKTTRRPLVLVGAGASRGERRDASRLLADAGLLIQRGADVVAQPRLIEPGPAGMLDAVADAGLVVAGLSDRWTTEGLGDTRSALARSAEAPVLFLRRGQRPGGLSPPESVTVYRWSMAASVG